MTGITETRGIANAVEFIEANIDRVLDLRSLARVSAMSVYHFARRFKETVGMSPHMYVVHRRVDRARQLLQCPECRMVDVAMACGFANQAHFTTVFREKLGVTPGQYRRGSHA